MAKLDLLKKWEWLIDDEIIPSKTKRSKYVRVFERIEQNNPKKYLKLLLPIAYRVMVSLDEFKMTNSKKNITNVVEFDEDMYIVENTVIMDFAEKFVSETADEVVKKYKETGVLGHIEITKNNNERYVSIIH